MSKNSFNKLESATNILRNILFIGDSIIIIILVIILFPQFKSQIKSAKIESLEIAGIKLNLYNNLNIPERIKGEEEIEISQPLKTVAELINYEGISWVYLGATPKGNKENWFIKYFNIVTIPKNGDIVKATADVFKRAEEPKIKEGIWTKGEIQGIIKRNQKVKIIDITEISGTQNRSLWWAKVLTL